jgi:CRISPR-associated protein Cas1
MPENKKLELASSLILQKINGQQDNLNWAYENNLMKQPVKLDTNFNGASIDELRIFEAVQSKTYWGNLAEIQMKFNRPKKVPSSEWHFVGSRTSVKTNSPKKAITPFHAILNYIYTLTSTRIKRCLVDYRVDPSLPIMHSLNAYRSSLVYDLIEPIRPMIDKKLLTSLQKDNSLYARVEHFLYSDGVCLLDPDYANVWHNRILTKELDKRIENIIKTYVQILKDHH